MGVGSACCPESWRPCANLWTLAESAHFGVAVQRISSQPDQPMMATVHLPTSSHLLCISDCLAHPCSAESALRKPHCCTSLHSLLAQCHTFQLLCMSWSLGMQEELADYINGTNPNVQFTSIQMLAILEEVRATSHVFTLGSKEQLAITFKSFSSCVSPVLCL